MFLSNNYVISLSPHPIRKRRVSLLVACFKDCIWLRLFAAAIYINFPYLQGSPLPFPPIMLLSTCSRILSRFRLLSCASDTFQLCKVDLSGSGDVVSTENNREAPSSTYCIRQNRQGGPLPGEREPTLKAWRVYQLTVCLALHLTKLLCEEAWLNDEKTQCWS